MRAQLRSRGRAKDDSPAGEWRQIESSRAPNRLARSRRRDRRTYPFAPVSSTAARAAPPRRQEAPDPSQGASNLCDAKPGGGRTARRFYAIMREPPTLLPAAAWSCLPPAPSRRQRVAPRGSPLRQGPTNRFVQCPGCAGPIAMAPPRGMHWLGGSGDRNSTLLTSRSKARWACGRMYSSEGKKFL